jgi:hypothetical protein
LTRAGVTWRWLRDLLEDALVGHPSGQLVRHEDLGERRASSGLLLDGDEQVWP